MVEYKIDEQNQMGQSESSGTFAGSKHEPLCTWVKPEFLQFSLNQAMTAPPAHFGDDGTTGYS